MWRIGTALTLATSLHAVVLGGALQWGEAGTGSHPATTAAALQVRTVQLTPPQPAAQDPAATLVAPALEAPLEPSLEAPQEASQEASAEPPPQAAAEAPAPQPEAPAPTATTTATAATTAPLSTPDVYHARRELSRAPKPLGPIDIAFPPGVPTPGRHSAVLAIYIDEAGTVRKVQPVDAPLPDAFEEAARNAFLAARFRAGERDSRPVKSFIHIEVVFEERPESRGLALSGLGQSSH